MNLTTNTVSIAKKEPKIVQIKAILPGSGKTYQLCKAYQEYSKAHPNERCIILTPTNKSKKICIENLQSFGMEKYTVKTMREYKKNYITQKAVSGNKLTKVYIPVATEKKYQRKALNIFIDEASMVSAKEIEDLLQSRTIKNLVLGGDSLQFAPIPYKSKLIYNDEVLGLDIENKRLAKGKSTTEWVDDGSLFSKFDEQIILDKQIRSTDPRVLELLSLIKEGKIEEALNKLKDAERFNKMEELNNDQIHIAYRKKTCEYINSLYTSPERFIVIKNDVLRGIAKSEIYEKEDIEKIRETWAPISAKKKSLTDELLDIEDREEEEEEKPEETFDDWFNHYFRAAYAVNAHKLQGESIKDKKIIIHLEDLPILLSAYENDYDKLLKEYQRYLYVAISRASSFDQLYIGIYKTEKEAGSYKKYLDSDKCKLDEKTKREQKAKKIYLNTLIEKNCKDFEYFFKTQKDCDLQTFQAYVSYNLILGKKPVVEYKGSMKTYISDSKIEGKRIIEKMPSMIDTDIREDSLRVSSLDFNCTSEIIKLMDNSEAIDREGSIGYEEYGNAHRVNHKQHKPHKEYKKMNDEDLLEKYKDIDISKYSGPKEFIEKTGLSKTLYYKLKSIEKENTEIVETSIETHSVEIKENEIQKNFIENEICSNNNPQEKVKPKLL